MVLFINQDRIEHDQEQALFDSISTETFKYLKQTDVESRTRLRDVFFQLKLPNFDEVKDFSGWQALFSLEHEKVLPFFGLAPQMEAIIAREGEGKKRAPKTLAELKHALALYQYARSAEDPEFARLCYLFNITEKRFNQCLDFMATSWPKKSSDLMPAAQVKTIHNGKHYYLVKLPIEDKRALILGDIVHCCQSIGGHSEMCVKDAVSLQNNGLYVLLRQKKAGNHEPMMNGQIDYDKFDIVLGSYAWRSERDNLCFDSLEGLSSVPLPVIKKTLTEFSEKLISADAADQPKVRRVNVGAGGGTPRGLFDLTTIPEKMKQGRAYGDAHFQCSIATNLGLRLNEHHVQALTALLSGYPKSFRDSILYLVECMADLTYLVEDLQKLLEQDPEFVHCLTPDTLEILLVFKRQITFDDLRPVDMSELESLDDAVDIGSVVRFIWRERTAGGLWNVLQHFSPSKRAEILEKIPDERLMSTILSSGDASTKEVKDAVFNSCSETKVLALIMRMAVSDTSQAVTLLGHVSIERRRIFASRIISGEVRFEHNYDILNPLKKEFLHALIQGFNKTETRGFFEAIPDSNYLSLLKGAASSLIRVITLSFAYLSEEKRNHIFSKVPDRYFLDLPKEAGLLRMIRRKAGGDSIIYRAFEALPNARLTSILKRTYGIYALEVFTFLSPIQREEAVFASFTNDELIKLLKDSYQAELKPGVWGPKFNFKANRITMLEAMSPDRLKALILSVDASFLLQLFEDMNRIPDKNYLATLLNCFEQEELMALLSTENADGKTLKNMLEENSQVKDALLAAIPEDMPQAAEEPSPASTQKKMKDELEEMQDKKQGEEDSFSGKEFK